MDLLETFLLCPRGSQVVKYGLHHSPVSIHVGSCLKIHSSLVSVQDSNLPGRPWSWFRGQHGPMTVPLRNQWM